VLRKQGHRVALYVQGNCGEIRQGEREQVGSESVVVYSSRAKTSEVSPAALSISRRSPITR
jgi:hypothetical protein